MAERPVFALGPDGMVVAHSIEFTWISGMSKSQKQKSIRSLHEAAKNKKSLKIETILEISSKSENPVGVALSAFNLLYKTPEGISAPVEVIFQGSKVFKAGGPYTDIYNKTPIEAKRDERLKRPETLRNFQYGNDRWKLEPRTVFYDWLYLSALQENSDLANELLKYDGFSDIEFNPKKSLNCQAAAAALHKVLVQEKLIDSAFSSLERFIEIHKVHKPESKPMQTTIF